MVRSSPVLTNLILGLVAGIALLTCASTSRAGFEIGNAFVPFGNLGHYGTDTLGRNCFDADTPGQSVYLWPKAFDPDRGWCGTVPRRLKPRPVLSMIVFPDDHPKLNPSKGPKPIDVALDKGKLFQDVSVGEQEKRLGEFDASKEDRAVIHYLRGKP